MGKKNPEDVAGAERLSHCLWAGKSYPSYHVKVRPSKSISYVP